MRGMHAQIGSSCQAKLVEAVDGVIYDIIIDARPRSKTFGVSSAFKLDPVLQNKLFVPRGFLHGFVVPKQKDRGNVVFNYYCDNTYDKSNEIGVSPVSFLNSCSVETWSKDESLSGLVDAISDRTRLDLSEKDSSGHDYGEFMASVLTIYNRTGQIWHSSGFQRKVLDEELAKGYNKSNV